MWHTQGPETHICNVFLKILRVYRTYTTVSTVWTIKVYPEGWHVRHINARRCEGLCVSARDKFLFSYDVGCWIFRKVYIPCYPGSTSRKSQRDPLIIRSTNTPPPYPYLKLLLTDLTQSCPELVIFSSASTIPLTQTHNTFVRVLFVSGKCLVKKDITKQIRRFFGMDWFTVSSLLCKPPTH